MVHGLRSAALALVIVGAATAPPGCQSFSPTECSVDEHCPQGFHCDQQHCRKEEDGADAGEGLDSGGSDGGGQDQGGGCPREVCADGHCPAAHECCLPADCGGVAWRCEAHACRCDGALSDDDCLVQNDNGCALGVWRTTDTLPQPIREQAAVAYGGHVYLLGGAVAGNLSLRDVYVGDARTNGTLGPWDPTSSLVHQRRSHAALAYRSHLYVFGGYDGGPLDSVEVAPINADGTLGAWTATTPLPQAVSLGESAVAYRGALYVLGGDPVGSGYSDQVLRAVVNDDGGLGAWQHAGWLPSPGLHRCHLFASHLYCLLQTAEQLDLLAAPLLADGTVGDSWSVIESEAPVRRRLATAASMDGCLHALGGFDTSAPVAEVRSSNLDPAGAASPWRTDASLLQGRGWGAATSINGYVYYLGGTDDQDSWNGLSDQVLVAGRAVLMHHVDFSQEPSVQPLGHHMYRLLAFDPVQGDYRVEYDWMTDDFVETGMGFDWALLVCEQSQCFNIETYDSGSCHTPDTGSGAAYGLLGVPSSEEAYWGPALRDTWYTIKITRSGGAGSWELFDQQGVRLTRMDITPTGYGEVDEIDLATWDMGYMAEEISWDAVGQRLYVHIHRDDFDGSDDSYIDNLYVFDL